ncbi:MAG TPA: asparagine synthase (glutamine-hydrolyzing) [Propionibacteriaceae bacterium]|nr:asparagine synthase (glutamine-hydrolyzing) [Propionibacteriaceae bacterium]
MCGVCGALYESGEPDVGLVEQMMGALSHRGPDGSGWYRDRHAVLGHTRLAIVDPARGVQPMSDERGRLWVTFNGEVYNHVELRAQLRDRGHTFATTCDAEVVVHAWEEWGPGALDRFNGQWAFALWDRAEETLVLCRDPYGVRPLYWTRANGRLLFASEVKALFVDASVTRELDPVGLDETFTFWSPVAPRTPFAGVQQVPPGCYLSVRNGVETLVRYWEPTFPARVEEDPGTLDEHAAGLRERLVAATRLRFERSDVPVAAYVSGGVDSAVTAGIISSFTGVRLDTFSLRFADAQFDEGPYQESVAGALGTTHRAVTVSDRDIADVFPEVVLHAEHPLLRTAPAPMYLLSRLVHEAGYKVVVTGEGADEVLAGYDIFRAAKVRCFIGRNPASTVRGRAVELLYPWLGRSPNLAPAFSQGFFGRHVDLADPALSHRPRWDTTSPLKAMLTDELRRTADSADRLVSSMPEASGAWDPLARAQWLELSTLLPGYILSSQGDRMLMAHSVEGRFPFLDPEVGRYAATLPARQKILGLDEKHLLKRAFADLVPADVLRRPKQPYRAPDAGLLVADPDWVTDVTSQAAVARAGVFRPAMVSRLLEKARRAGPAGLGNTDSMRLVAVLSVQLLQRLLLDELHRPGPPPAPVTAIDHLSRNRGDHELVRT